MEYEGGGGGGAGLFLATVQSLGLVDSVLISNNHLTITSVTINKTILR